LLNTRRYFADLNTQYRELSHSVASYGMPDLASIDTSTIGAREDIGPVIERSIALHEPRLRNIKATLLRSESVELSATFHIEAELRVDPAPAVMFETKVELTTGHVAVREGAD
jgi:type VI secretion system protein ImpF